MKNLNRKKLYLDVDGVIINTIRTYCHIYNVKMCGCPNFVKATWNKVTEYNFKDQCSLPHDGFFELDEMYKDAFYMPWAIRVIDLLKQKYEIIIVTIGTPKNIKNKKKYLKRFIDYDDFIGVDINKYKDKSHIDMSDGIFVDDLSANLKTSNAERKILFGDIQVWNGDWDGEHVSDWLRLKDILWNDEVE